VQVKSDEHLGEEEERKIQQHAIKNCEDIETIYEMLREIGRGAFGTVMEAEFKQTRTKVAIKIISNVAGTNQQIGELKNEINILHCIQDRYCVSLVASKETSDNLYIVMEFVEGGDLMTLVENTECGRLEEMKASQCMFDILNGLAYLHSNCIVHRDIKPDNILYSKHNDTYKIGDFGSSINFTNSSTLTGLCGTLSYCAPEMMKGEYTEAVDLWSCGVMAFVIMCGYEPWDDPPQMDIMSGVAHWEVLEKVIENQDNKEHIMSFVKGLMEWDVEKRMKPNTALIHPWLCGEQEWFFEILYLIP